MRLLASILVVSALLLSLAGCKVSNPGSIESSVVKEVKRTVTVGGKDWTNPTPDDQASWNSGKGHFQHHCAFCHGLDGHNTGVPYAQHMSPPVPDLADKDVQDYSDGQLKWIIQNGIAPSGMPAWNGVLEEEEMWHIVRFLRKLPPKGSQGVPAYFSESEEEHQKTEQQGAKPAEHEHKH